MDPRQRFGRFEAYHPISSWFMVETADNDAALSPVEALFKKNQLAAEGPTAALEYRERQKATLENMKRLRALRLAMPTGAKKHSRRSSRT